MKIAVCVKLDPERSTCFSLEGDHYNLRVLHFIERTPFNKGFMGNFVPHYCQYKRQEYMVHGSIDHAYMHEYSGDAYILTEEVVT